MRLFYSYASPSKKHGQSWTIRPPVCRAGSHPEVCAFGWDELGSDGGIVRISETCRSGRQITLPEQQEQIINTCICKGILHVRYNTSVPYCTSFSSTPYMTFTCCQFQLINLSNLFIVSDSFVIWFSFHLSCKRHRQCGGGMFWWLLPLGQYRRLPETNGSVGRSTKWSPIASLDPITQPPLLVMQDWGIIVEGVSRASSISWIIFRNSASMQFGSHQCKARSQLARRISQV